MDKIQIGQQAPDFTLRDQNNNQVSLHQYKGSWILLYFYPKDNTPNCTQQACKLRDIFEEYQKEGITIIGVSTDSIESHKKFATKHNLPFTLLADTQAEVAKKYNIWKPKKLFGREFLGTRRSSFLVDPQLKIQKIYEKVNVNTHADIILADKKELQDHAKTQ